MKRLSIAALIFAILSAFSLGERASSAHKQSNTGNGLARPEGFAVGGDPGADPLPEGVVARIRTTKLVAPDIVRHLDFVKDGKELIAGGDQNAMRLDAESGKVLSKFRVSARGGQCRKWSSAEDGTIAGAIDGGVQVWEGRTGKLLHKVKDGTCVGLAPDGTLAAVAMGRILYILDVRQRKLTKMDLPAWSSYSRHVNLCISSDRKLCAVLLETIPGKKKQEARHTVFVVQLADGKETTRFDVPDPCWKTCLAFNADGTRLARADANGVRLIDLTTGKEEKAKFEIRAPVGAMRFVGDQLFAFEVPPHGVGEGRVHVLEPATGKSAVRLKVPMRNRCFAAAISADGKKLAWVADYLTDARGTRPGVTVPEALSALCVADLVTGKTLTVGDYLYTSTMSANGNRLATHGIDQTLRVWDTGTAKQLAAFPEIPLSRPIVDNRRDTGRWERGRGMALSPDGTRLALFVKNRLQIIDVDPGRDAWQYDHEKAEGVFDAGSSLGGIVAFSPDGTRLASLHGNESVWRVWDARTGKAVGECKEADAIHGYYGRRNPAFSSDNRFLCWAGKIWRTDQREQPIRTCQGWPRSKEQLFGLQGPLDLCCSFVGDNKMLAAVAEKDHCLILWETASGKERFRIPTDPNTVDVWIDDSRMIMLRAESIVCRSLASDGETIWRLQAKLPTQARIVGVSADGCRIAVQHADAYGTVLVLDLTKLPRES